MSAPSPLPGTYSTSTNPFYAGYQNQQFRCGSLGRAGTNASHGGLVGPQNIWDAIANDPAAATTAVIESDPLESQADFWALTPQVVTFFGAPTGGTFALGFGAAFTAAITYTVSLATATLQTALQLVPALNAVTVTGTAGGPFTVAGAQLTGQMLTVASNALQGGVAPYLKITSPAQQPGIAPF